MDDWKPPEEHHAISIDAMKRWTEDRTLSKKDLMAIHRQYSALFEGGFDELRDAAASLLTTMCTIAKAGDEKSAKALHRVILTARPRFNRWRAQLSQRPGHSQDARRRMNALIGADF